MRAERRLDEMLKAAKEAGQIGVGKRARDIVDGDDNKKVKLSDAGITRDLSSRAQKLAGISEEEFGDCRECWQIANDSYKADS